MFACLDLGNDVSSIIAGYVQKSGVGLYLRFLNYTVGEKDPRTVITEGHLSQCYAVTGRILQSRTLVIAHGATLRGPNRNASQFDFTTASQPIAKSAGPSDHRVSPRDA